MTIKDWIQVNKDEKPLDVLKTDGGYTGIFRTLAIVGDSLSAGEFEGRNEHGECTWHDMPDYSWGAYLGRMAGISVHNFSRGGMTAQEFVEGYAEQKGYWDQKYAAQGYILALGVNDLYCQKQEIGDISDISAEAPEKNRRTFAGYYAQIVQRLKRIQPDAKFFFVTLPREFGREERCFVCGDEHQKLMYRLAKYFTNCYVIDLRKYAPVYDEAFKKEFYLYGHMNPMGYLFTAKMIGSYIDYIIRYNKSDFNALGGMGTDFAKELCR